MSITRQLSEGRREAEGRLVRVTIASIDEIEVLVRDEAGESVIVLNARGAAALANIAGDPTEISCLADLLRSCVGAIREAKRPLQ